MRRLSPARTRNSFFGRGPARRTSNGRSATGLSYSSLARIEHPLTDDFLTQQRADRDDVACESVGDAPSRRLRRLQGPPRRVIVPCDASFMHARVAPFVRRMFPGLILLYHASSGGKDVTADRPPCITFLSYHTVRSNSQSVRAYRIPSLRFLLAVCLTFWLMRLCFHVDVSLSICLALRLSAPNQPFLVR